MRIGCGLARRLRCVRAAAASASVFILIQRNVGTWPVFGAMMMMTRVMLVSAVEVNINFAGVVVMRRSRCVAAGMRRSMCVSAAECSRNDDVGRAVASADAQGCNPAARPEANHGEGDATEHDRQVGEVTLKHRFFFDPRTRHACEPRQSIHRSEPPGQPHEGAPLFHDS